MSDERMDATAIAKIGDTEYLCCVDKSDGVTTLKCAMVIDQQKWWQTCKDWVSCRELGTLQTVELSSGASFSTHSLTEPQSVLLTRKVEDFAEVKRLLLSTLSVREFLK